MSTQWLPAVPVLAVPVPALDPVVRAHTARHDSSFLSTDPAFSNAHVTVLAPWLSDPTEADLAVVGEIVGEEPAFDVCFAEVGQFPDGTLHLVPDPAAPFARITARLAEAFPQTPPYQRRFLEVVPHLTIDHVATGAGVESVTDDLAALLPLHTRAERVDLQWWANDDCHVRHSWRLSR